LASHARTNGSGVRRSCRDNTSGASAPAGAVGAGGTAAAGGRSPSPLGNRRLRLGGFGGCL
jgi:hypothetical protein